MDAAIKPVIVVTPSNSTETIENIEEDSKFCIIMVIIDECKSEGLAVVTHQTICQENTKESQPNLNEKTVRDICKNICASTL